MSFPNSESVNFPHRKGCLNFYDDSCHKYVPDINEIINIFNSEGVEIIKVIKGYKPVVLRVLGAMLEPISLLMRKVLIGTWQFYGFESIIIGKKN